MSITAKQIIESAPLRFRHEKAYDIDTIFHFELKGEPTIAYTMVIKNGSCELQKGLHGEASCVIKTTQALYVELETGKANPQLALMMGKVKVSNISEMIGFAKLFRKFDESYLHANTSIEKLEIIKRPKLNGPLEGVRILDFSRLLPGPLATMFLADMGAEVLKIEDPDNPDYVRDIEPMLGDTSAFYYALNRNKKSLAINFLHPEGKKIITQLLQSTDVLVEQYRPRVMEHFGFGYEQVKTINPKIIYVSITGYGQNNSMSQMAGHDLNYIATSGVLSTIGTDKNHISIPGVQIADIAGGSYMSMNAILAALYQREKTGQGQHINLSMTNAALPLVAMQFAEQQATGKASERGQFQLAGGLANYNVYRCKDGKFLAVGSLEPKFWNKVCELIGKTEWSKEIFSNFVVQNKVRQAFQELLLQKDSVAWLTLFKGHEVCISPINEIADIALDHHFIETNAFAIHTINGNDFKSIKNPFLATGMKENEYWTAPKLGEDTNTLLLDLGIDNKTIQHLRTERVIK